jgi:hypothetical protein
MINEPIYPLANLDYNDSDLPNQIPPLHKLQKMQELCIQGYSEEEAEAICKRDELSEEEVEFIRKQAVKEWNREIRAFKRSKRKEEEEKMWSAIFRKRVASS